MLWSAAAERMAEAASVVVVVAVVVDVVVAAAAAAFPFLVALRSKAARVHPSSFAPAAAARLHPHLPSPATPSLASQSAARNHPRALLLLRQQPLQLRLVE